MKKEKWKSIWSCFHLGIVKSIFPIIEIDFSFSFGRQRNYIIFNFLLFGQGVLELRQINLESEFIILNFVIHNCEKRKTK